MSEDKADKFEKVFEKVNGASGSHERQRLERTYNDERSNLIKLRQDVGSAITIDKQLEQQLKSLKRQHFESGGSEVEIINLENRLNEHRKVKDALKAQLAKRELQLQKVYDEKPGLLGALISEPKNIFAVIVVLVIVTALTKLF
ncbi:hypothetical protein BH10CYA1_BH10CYA1_36290 [soil metagenome]